MACVPMARKPCKHTALTLVKSLQTTCAFTFQCEIVLI